MIPGSNISPYRSPCGATTLCANGPRYQHARASEKNIPVYIYDSVVTNWNTEIGGNIPPYERYADNGEAGNCESNGCVIGGAPCRGWQGNAYSDQYNLGTPFPTPAYYQPQMCIAATIINPGSGYSAGDILSANGGTTSTYVAPDGTTPLTTYITVTSVNGAGGITGISITRAGSYKSTPTSPNAATGGHGSGATFDLTYGNQTENISPCFKYGFKNVQAMRQWHGTPGYFFNYNPSVYPCDDTTYGSDCAVEIYDQYSLSASQTKYCHVAYEITGTFGAAVSPCSGDAYFLYGSAPVTDTYSATLSVDPGSGVVTVSDANYGCGAASWYAGMVQWTLADWIAEFTMIAHSSFNTPDGEYGFGDPAGPPSGFYTVDCSDSGWSFSGYSDSEGAYPYTAGSSNWTIGSGSFSATRTYESEDRDDDGSLNGWMSTETVTVADDSVSYTFEGQQLEDSSWSTVYDFTISISLSTPNTAADVLSDITTLLDEWDLTNDAVYPWRNDNNTSLAPMVMRNEVASPVSPLGFTVFSSSATEIDDCQGNAPGDPDYNQTCAYTTNTDPNAALYDGSIIGAPLDAGYQGFFDFYYQDWQWCLNDSVALGYLFGWGQANNYAAQNHGIPRTATHWTPNNIGWQMPGGAWIFYNCNPSWAGSPGACASNPIDRFNFPPATVLIAQKWAETKMGFPSQNFFRPAGDDKFSLDQENIFAVNSISGSNVFLISPINCNPVTANSSGLWGGDSVNGFFEVSGNGNPFTLGTKIFDLPSDWQSPSSDTANCFGLLRFPDAFPILGFANVSNVANTMPVELTTDSLPNLGMGLANANADHIDIFDSQMNLLSANQPVTRIDDSHFTVNANFAAIQNAGIIMSNGAPDYYWDDQYSKGDYVYTDWTWWPRLICEADRWNSLVAACPPEGATCSCPSGSETVYCFPYFNPVEDDAGSFSNAFHQEANCVPFNPCSPAVLCISPNGETFDNGATYDFPSIYLDEEYGSGWQAEFQQVMQDLLYQAPHFPCPSIANCATPNFAWTEDGGSCAGDSNTVHYYAHAPMVEARITLPSGAPSLPSGIEIGWSSPAGIVDSGSNCSSYPSNTLFPPNSNGYGLAANTLWALWIAECDCVANAGRFSAEYSNDVVGCQ